jgi:hypothetical protein
MVHLTRRDWRRVQAVDGHRAGEHGTGFIRSGGLVVQWDGADRAYAYTGDLRLLSDDDICHDRRG